MVGVTLHRLHRRISAILIDCVCISVYIPVHVTRDNRRQTIDLHLKIANRKENPSLGYVSWNINVRQLECVKEMSPVITGRIGSPMTPMLARAVTTDMEFLGN